MKVTLYYRQGTSDKIYVLEKVAAVGGYQINFAYGRRGSTLQTGTKTANAVDELKADKVFTKIYKEKTSEGYTDSADGVPFTPCSFDLSQLTGAAATAGTPAAAAHAPAITPAAKFAAASFTTAQDAMPTGINVQLLNPVESDELERFFSDNQIAAQQKFDGKRTVLVLDKNEVYGVNRTGLRCGIPAAFVTGIEQVAALCRPVLGNEIDQMMIDGEAVVDEFFAFDLLELNGIDFRQHSYLNRWTWLKNILYAGESAPPVENFVCAELYGDEAAKREFFARAKSNGMEGVVFKNVNAPYEAGRPAQGGSQRKYKFCAEATCVVAAQNGDKRSVALQVSKENGELLDIGNCTIPANFKIPQVGALVEIRYLYAYRNGALYQPVYKGERSDKEMPDVYSSLKFKAEAAA